MSSAVISPWYPLEIPTSTFLSSINPSKAASLLRVVALVTSVAATETNTISLHYLSRSLRGAQASLTIIAGKEFLATATATQEFPQITQALFNATLNLDLLEEEGNLYVMDPSYTANLIFTIAFAVVLAAQIILAIYGKTAYFGVCFFCGSGLEFAGYLARALAVDDTANMNKFLVQIICLTIAPAFIMAGIYYFLALLLVMHGQRYSVLRPLWFSYVFVFCDVLSLVIQAVGGAITATSLLNFESTTGGTNIMVAGIAFQVASMTLFLVLFFDFVNRTFFRASHEVQPSFKRFLHMLFNTAEGRRLKIKCEPAYDDAYTGVRSRPLFKWAPLIVLFSVGFIYVRCIYRVVELAEGWTGYLIVHEVYIMILDALMCFLTTALYVFLHPTFIIGRGLKFSFKKNENKSEKMVGDVEWDDENGARESVETEEIQRDRDPEWDTALDHEVSEREDKGTPREYTEELNRFDKDT